MKRKNSLNYARYGYIFSLPFIITFLIFSLYPTIYTGILGFTDRKGLIDSGTHFLENPFENFSLILSNSTFQISIQNTVLIWVMNFIPQIFLALLLTAWLTSRQNRLRGKGFFKVMFYMPNIITAATVAILFSSLFGYPMGPVNSLVTSWGISDSPINFLVNKWNSRIIVAFIQFWMWYGYTMIILVSGVLGISPEIYEAADLDGASGVQTFFKITIPNLQTILLYTLITSLIGGLNMFDISRLFNQGGPDNATLTTSAFIYNQAFSGSYMYNRASAASMIMFVIIAFFSGVIFFLMRDKDQEKQRKTAKKMASAQKKTDKEEQT